MLYMPSWGLPLFLNAYKKEYALCLRPSIFCKEAMSSPVQDVISFQCKRP